MKSILLAVSLALISSAAFAKKDCEELKSEIDAKMKAKGVANYTLEIVDANAATEDKVVGTCDAGQKKIVYKRGK